jgi:hypothetical protein
MAREREAMEHSNSLLQRSVEQKIEPIVRERPAEG